MLYYRCPTCRTILADKQIPFENGMEKICNITGLSKREQEDKKKELLDKLYVINYCCRMRMLTYVKLIDLVR